MTENKESKKLSVQNPESKSPDLSVFMNYEYEVDVNGDNALAFVIKFVGDNKKVLEVGAGSGMISKKLVDLNQCQVTAAEINDTSLAKLRKITRSVYKTDLNRPGWSKDFKREGKFDVIVAADVLEHLYDPWAILVEMKSLLNETGEIVLSLPHIGHSGIFASLYCEDFEYKEWGLLDKTHIRFFGLNNIRALHENAGLTITDVKYVIYTPEASEFAREWSKLPEKLKELLDQNPHGRIYQVVTKASPVERGLKGINLFEHIPPLPVSASHSNSPFKNIGNKIKKLFG